MVLNPAICFLQGQLHKEPGAYTRRHREAAEYASPTMATSSITVIAPNAKKAVIKITSTTLMDKVLEEACSKLLLDPKQYALK